MELSFKIPINHNELLESSSEKFYVKNIYNSDQLPKLLNDARIASNSADICKFITEHFDTFFGIIDNGNHVQTILTLRAFTLLYHVFDNFHQKLKIFLESNSTNNEKRNKYLNSLQMILYLQCEIVKINDKKHYQLDDLRKKQAKRDEEINANNDWAYKKYQFLVQIFNLIQLPIEKLWNPPVVSENFTNLLCDFCYNTLEIKNVKTKQVDDVIFRILGTAVKRYNHAMTLPIKLLEILKHYEHAIVSVAQGIHILYNDCKIQSIFSKIINEIVEELSNNDSDSQVSKHFGLFLNELSKISLEVIIPHLTFISDELLNNQSLILRNGILKMLGDAICQQLTSEDLSDEMKEIRDDFLEKLFDHLMDVNAHVRAKVLNIFHQLKEENAIPLSYQYKVLDMTVERLYDKANLVRKNAIILIKIFLEHNPFGDKLSLEELNKNYEIEQKKLEDIKNALNEIRRTETDSESHFDNIVPKLQILLKETRTDVYKPEDLTKLCSDMTQAASKVKEYLTTNELYKAVKLVQMFEAQAETSKLIQSLTVEVYTTYFTAILYDYYMGNFSTKELNENYAKQAKVVSFLKDTIEFSEKIEEALKILEEFLLSKNTSDVIETVDLFTTGYLFGIKGCENGIIAMLNLVWVPEKEKRDAVTKAYQRILFTTDKQGRSHAIKVVINLSNFFNHLKSGYAKAFEFLVKEWVECGEIDKSIIQVMFERFTMKLELTNEEDSRKALELLVMASKAKPSIVQANKSILEQIGIEEYGKKDIRYFNSTLILLKQLVIQTTESKYYKRLEPSDSSITLVVDNFKNFFWNKNIVNFDQVTSSVFDLIYHLTISPDLITEEILDYIFQTLIEKYNMPDDIACGSQSNAWILQLPSYLSIRLIHLIGYIAMKELICLDIDIYNNTKYRQELNLDRQKQNVKRKTMSGNVSAMTAVKRLSIIPNEKSEDNVAETISVDDRIAEMINHICEKVMLTSNEIIFKNILNSILDICQHPSRYNNEILFRASVLCMIRFMFISSDFCELNLPFLMNILKGSNDVKVKINVLIGLADLMFRFPNSIGSWTKQFYGMLYEENDEVRLAAVKMLSYLIMQEMIRVKGQIADLALCIVDKNEEIRTTTKQFFKEIANKPNTLYNILPDIIAKLGDADFNLEEEKYRTIMSYIFALIEKNRQIESLVDRLCLRFKTTKEERQWRDTVFCLTLLTHTEKTIRKLIEHIPLYKDKIQVDEVYSGFKSIIANTLKLAKQELKDILKELETKLDECLEVHEQIISTESAQSTQPSTQPATSKKNQKKIPRKKTKTIISDSEEEEASSESESSDSETKTNSDDLKKSKKSSKKINSEDEQIPKKRSSKRFRLRV